MSVVSTTEVPWLVLNLLLTCHHLQSLCFMKRRSLGMNKAFPQLFLTIVKELFFGRCGSDIKGKRKLQRKVNFQCSFQGLK
jgi:hypothetical protein